MKQSPKKYAESIVELCSRYSREDVEHTVENLVQYFSKRGKMKFLNLLKQEIIAVIKKQNKEFDATLTSSHPVREELVAELTQALEKQVQGTVRLDAIVDPQLIAGSIIMIGDTRIDASLSSRFNTLAHSLLSS